MTDGIRVRWTVKGKEKLEAALKELGVSARGKMLVNAAIAGALPVQNAAKQNAPKKTSHLRRSIHTEVMSVADERVEVGVGTDVEYAAIQEFGGTIVPKNVQYLAIPLTKEAEQHVTPLNFPGKLKPFIKGGRGVMVDEAGTAQYALVKSVTIPAHPYLRPALDEKADAAKAAMGRALKKQLEAVGK